MFCQIDVPEFLVSFAGVGIGSSVSQHTHSGYFSVLSLSFSTLRAAVSGLVYTVHKTGLILRSTDRKPNIQFSMAST